jgi:hypothetical protein
MEAESTHTPPPAPLQEVSGGGKGCAAADDLVPAKLPAVVVAESVPSVASPLKEAISLILTEVGRLPIHALGSSLSRAMGSAYKKELRLQKLVQYVSAQDWLVVDSAGHADPSVALSPTTSIADAGGGLSTSTSDHAMYDAGKAENMEEIINKDTKKAANKNKNKNKPKVDDINRQGDIVISCPHCEIDILVAKKSINCGIFRHGALKATGRPMKPHCSQAVSEELVRSGKIFGCGQPFQITTHKETEPWSYSVAVCGWI